MARRALYSIKFNAKTITLTPLSPQQVRKAIKGKEVKKESLFMNGQQVEGSHLKDLRANLSQPGEDDAYVGPSPFLSSISSSSHHATQEVKMNEFRATYEPKDAIPPQFWSKSTFGVASLSGLMTPLI